MTTAVLKEALHDRIVVLEHGLHAVREEFPYTPWSVSQAREESRLEGRLEEVKVCLALVDNLQLEEEHPLLELRGDVIRHVPWGKQSRGDWPQSTFGVADEAEPGVNRYDPGRC
jgi:hypothetical protein